MSEQVFPASFVARIKQQLGDESVDFFNALEEKVPTSVRLNPHKPSSRFAEDEQVPWCPLGKYLPERPSFAADPLIFAGAYYVQEASSMVLWKALEKALEYTDQPRILDLCAAPGGKSTLISSFIGQEGLLVTNEVDNKRVGSLTENIVRWGASNVIVTQSPANAFEPLGEFFDVIVVDAPCSGEGMFRKDPKAIQVWHEKFPYACSHTQRNILESAVRLLKPGGSLIYSTCTFAEEEDELILDHLLTEYPLEARELDIDPAWGIQKAESKEGGIGYRFWPHKAKGEGFFVSLMEKNQSVASGQFKSKKKNAYWEEMPKKYRRIIGSWLEDGESYSYFSVRDIAHAIPKRWNQEAKKISLTVKTVLIGIEMGKAQKDMLIPSHHLAMYSQLTANIPRLATDLSNARAYLQKHEPSFLEQTEKGWGVVTYEGHSLGWVKILPNRVNNHYPANLRLKKTFGE